MHKVHPSQITVPSLSNSSPIFCNFCEQIPSSPKSCKSCLFIFCEDCFAYLTTFSEKCICGSPIEAIRTLPKFILKKLEKQSFFCKNLKVGCSLIFPFKEIHTHQMICFFNAILRKKSNKFVSIQKNENLPELNIGNSQQKNTFSSFVDLDLFKSQIISNTNEELEILSKLKNQIFTFLKISDENDKNFDFFCKICSKFSCRTQLDQCNQCQEYFCYMCSKNALVACSECKLDFCARCFKNSDLPEKCASCFFNGRQINANKYYAKRTFESKIPKDRIFIQYLQKNDTKDS